ncbi:HlyD family efflux transporter periplasmic adaptor subunit [Lactobacillus agrestimuris]|uniref:HlyD family efflux transporter periplasmic adaptor subunit n=1 Tax=Lactobacillus agrestimuris TaxID=2941328 RepID=UPI002043AB08|nr:HlyD family efflux transporter periplasmic adaptor subunit [Lactobacillus agrestimuris]
MNNQNLESSKFYSYKFRNFSAMIILPAFILVILLFIGSFFAVHENVVNSIGVVTPDYVVPLKNNEYKEGQKISKGTTITLADNKKRLIKNNIIVHLDAENIVAMPDIKDKSILKIVTYIPDDEVATLASGQKIRFQVKNRQGVLTILNGKVISIGTYPVQQKGINVFKVDALIKTTKSKRKFLRYGTQGKVTIITGRISYFNYIKSEVLNSK